MIKLHTITQNNYQMRWRNIHTQHILSNSTSSLKKNNNKRYTPTRRDKTDFSKQLFSSLTQSQEIKQSKKENNLLKVFEHKMRNQQFVAYETKIFKLKKQVHALIKYSQSLCDMIKNYVHHLNKILKNSAETMREQIVEQMHMVVKNLLKYLPESRKSCQSNQHIKTKTPNVKQPIKPTILDNNNFHQQFGTSRHINISSIDETQKNFRNSKSSLEDVKHGANKKDSYQKQRNKIKQYGENDNKINNEIKRCVTQSKISNQQHQQNLTSPTNHNLSTILPQKQSLNTPPEYNQSQVPSQVTFMPPQKKKAKQKQHGKKIQKTEETTSHSEITNPHQFKSERNQEMLINIEAMKKQIDGEKKGKYKHSKTERIYLHDESKMMGIQNRNYYYYKNNNNRDMQQRISNMNNCIDNMKKILQKPA